MTFKKAKFIRKLSENYRLKLRCVIIIHVHHRQRNSDLVKVFLAFEKGKICMRRTLKCWSDEVSSRSVIFSNIHLLWNGRNHTGIVYRTNGDTDFLLPSWENYRTWNVSRRFVFSVLVFPLLCLSNSDGFHRYGQGRMTVLPYYITVYGTRARPSGENWNSRTTVLTLTVDGSSHWELSFARESLCFFFRT